jgi:hypothetical protein
MSETICRQAPAFTQFPTRYLRYALRVLSGNAFKCLAALVDAGAAHGMGFDEIGHRAGLDCGEAQAAVDELLRHFIAERIGVSARYRLRSAREER